MPSRSFPRSLKPEQLKGCSIWDLMIARNGIYARHGRPFSHRMLRSYFHSWPWYQPDAAYSDARLIPIESRNISPLLKQEQLLAARRR